MDSKKPIEVARKAAEAASNKQAFDIMLLDTREVCSFTDCFIICSGESERQIKSISDEIEKVLKDEGISLHHSEGTADSGWILLDYGDIIVHIFSPFERDFYQLDELWNKANLLVRIQ